MLTDPQLEAAKLTAEGLSAAKCSAAVRVCKKTIERWRASHEFQARVHENVLEIRSRIRNTGAAVKELRIKNKKRRLAAYHRILKARAGNPDAGGASWDTTGFMLQKVVCVGGAQFGQFVTEYEFDAGLAAAIRAEEDGLADEMGERRKLVERAGYLNAPPSERVLNLAAHLEHHQILALITVLDTAKATHPADVPDPPGVIIDATAGVTLEALPIAD